MEVSMWPHITLPVPADVNGQLAILFFVGLTFVLGAFAAMLARMASRRREIRRVRCPEDRRAALVVVRPSLDGSARDRIAYCSRWHGRRLDCGERCLERRAS
jgi:hypothetical protein